MSRSALGALVAVGVVLPVACSDTLAPEDIAGTWNATSMVFISSNNPAITEDVITLGAEFSITFRGDGTLTSTFDFEDSTSTDTGTYVLDGSDIALTIEGDVVSGRITKTGDELRINVSEGLEYDFDGDEVEDPAALLLVMTEA